MIEPPAREKKHTPLFLSQGGEMGQRLRDFDWAKTPLGDAHSWPQSLRTCVRIMLTSQQPIWIGWGKQLIKLYNDPYRAIVGGKHPWALGQPASVVWKDIWRDIEPMLKQVMEKGEGTYVESQLLIMHRNGYPEETYYTFSYTPIPGDTGEIEGMICFNTEDTERIRSERQLLTLTQLGKNLTDSKTDDGVITNAINTLSENDYDFPFALFYTLDGDKAVLAHATDTRESSGSLPGIIDINANNEFALLLRQARDERELQALDDLFEKFGAMPKGAWEIQPSKAVILPIASNTAKEPFGFLVFGLNPYRLPDEKYKAFFSLVSDQLATSFASVHMLEEERKRAESLAEIDRAKTTFFSNISHEFRTPLTLLLGPLQDTLNSPGDTEANKVRVDVAHRNALRMQKLVNTLLDFSRIEANRMEGAFSKVDICAFTHELASSFQSAIDKAGMQLQFNCGNIRDEVYVDVDMWEKIILNLVSNAFKYSKQGTITIDITQQNEKVLVAVADTGIGIAENQLDKIFDRFHRAENADSRSQEGTGIGLAMVKELVKIHDGQISVSSQLGHGSVFTVSIPVGHAHLPADKIVMYPHVISVNGYASAFVEEALKWLPDEAEDNTNNNTGTIANLENKTYTVLLADDNTDMRNYLSRLLAEHYNIITAHNGQEAYNKMLQYQPNLVLTDVMMPVIDGFGLLKKVRAHPSLKNTPVLFLSARAGEEAKLEGLDAGADDYLVKPFSARELIARVDGNLKISTARREAEQELFSFLMQAPVAIVVLSTPGYVSELANALFLQTVQRTKDEINGQPIFDVIPEFSTQGIKELLDSIMAGGEPVMLEEYPATIFRNGTMETGYFNVACKPVKRLNGDVDRMMFIIDEVTEQVITRKKIEESEKGLNELANAVPQLVWITNPEGHVTYYNNRIEEFGGVMKDADGEWNWDEFIHKDDYEKTAVAWRNAVEQITPYQVEHRLQMKNRDFRWHLSRGVPHKNAEGQVVKWFGTSTDIQVSKEQASMLEGMVQKRTAQLNELNLSLQQSNVELQQFAHVASHDIKEPLRKIKIFTGRLADDTQNNFSDKSKSYISKIESATGRLFLMIEGVLNYSLINNTEQRIESIDINDVIKNIESDLELVINQKSATLQYKNLPVIDGAAVLIYQLFYNLINNSLKFSKAGVPLEVNITSSIVNDDGIDYAEIVLTDNGIGFAPDEAEKIFGTFARLNNKDKYEGTGLGLALCRRIVQRHSGIITATGQPGESSTFTITLPLKQKKQRL